MNKKQKEFLKFLVFIGYCVVEMFLFLSSITSNSMLPGLIGLIGMIIPLISYYFYLGKNK